VLKKILLPEIVMMGSIMTVNKALIAPTQIAPTILLVNPFTRLPSFLKDHFLVLIGKNQVF